MKNNFSRFLLLFIYLATVTLSNFTGLLTDKAFANDKLISVSKQISEPILKGIKLDLNSDNKIELIFDSNDRQNTKDEYVRLLSKYFLAALSMPDEKIWVNLSPYESDRIINDALVQTDLGKVLIEQDLLLKQLASSLTYPGTYLGKKYWQNHSTNNDTKIWIKSGNVELIENGTTILIKEAKLKVSSENLNNEILIPSIEEEVNHGQNFNPLRQIYSAVILAKYLKHKLKHGNFKALANSEVNNGIRHKHAAIKEDTYKQYLASVKNGTYNVALKIKDENNKRIKRNYFCGGIDIIPNKLKLSSSINDIDKLSQGNISKAELTLKYMSSAIESETNTRDSYSEIFKNEIYDKLDQKELVKDTEKIQEIRTELITMIGDLEEKYELVIEEYARDNNGKRQAESWLFDHFLKAAKVLKAFDVEELNEFNMSINQYSYLRNKIVKHNLKYVMLCARKFRGRGLSIDDLMYYGIEGLYRAIDTYDPSTGFKFLTYANGWINNKIIAAIRNTVELIPVSDTRKNKLRKYREAKLKDDIATLDAYSNKELAELAETMNFNNPVSLDKPTADEENSSTLMDRISDEDDNILSLISQKEVRDRLNKYIDELDSKEQMVIRLRHELIQTNNGKPTLDEIGKMINVSRERIRQIETRALNKLKKKIYGDELLSHRNGGIEFDLNLKLDAKANETKISQTIKLNKIIYEISDAVPINDLITYLNN